MDKSRSLAPKLVEGSLPSLAVQQAKALHRYVFKRERLVERKIMILDFVYSFDTVTVIKLS
jgi:hypothetical protein